MGNLEPSLLRRIAEPLYWENPVHTPSRIEDNALLKLLYTAYCKQVKEAPSWSKIQEENRYGDLCGTLFSWYKNRYTRFAGMDSGKQGMKRIITEANTFCDDQQAAYHFSALYKGQTTFNRYLSYRRPDERQLQERAQSTEDLLAFILHTGVAFLVPPADLDKLLQAYGLHTLHVKNIHHLAIYTVLAEGAKLDCPMPEDYNPFAEVESLYTDARTILLAERPSAEIASSDAYRSSFLRKIWMQEKQLTRGQFKEIVRQKARGLNMRHSLILQEYHKFIAVYTHIFNNYLAGRGLPPDDNGEYSFFSFVRQFSRSFPNHKKFIEQINAVDKDRLHPTREIMILFWLYTYCFSTVQGAAMSDAQFAAMQAHLRVYDPAWAEEANAYRKNGLFDVYGFFYQAQDRTVDSCFKMSDFIAMVTEQLTDYNWGVLSLRSPFDYYILKLQTLTIHIDQNAVRPGARRILLEEKDLLPARSTYLSAGNVPAPLCVLHDLFSAIQEVGTEELRKTSAQAVYYPLACAISELV